MFPFINSGCSRNVYEINDDLVLKLAKSAPHGKEQCISELNAYLKYKNIIPICKVYVEYCSDTRIVMERVLPIDDNLKLGFTCDELEYILDIFPFRKKDDEVFKNIPDIIKRFIDKFFDSGLTPEEIQNIMYDIGYENIGIKNNDLYILDLGYV